MTKSQMSKFKIDREMSSLIGQIISSQSIDDADKEMLRHRAKETLGHFYRFKNFAWTMKFELILSGLCILFAIIAAFARVDVAGWATPLSIGISSSILFGILTVVFRYVYYKKLAALQADFSVLERKSKGKKYPIVSNAFIVCLFSRRGYQIEIRTQKDSQIIGNQPSQAFSFIETSENLTVEISHKKFSGSLSLARNECAIYTAYVLKNKVTFEKQAIKLPESAVFATEENQSPVALEAAPVAAPVSALVTQRVVKPSPVNQTPNELIDISEVDTSAESISIKNGKMAFLVFNNDVCDALKPGNYFIDIDVFPRLKTVNPNALSSNSISSLKLITIDTEKVYQMHWKLTGNVFAKGDVEFQIANSRLFLNCVIEGNLMSKEQFEEEVTATLNPSIRKALENEKGSDYDLIEKNILKAANSSLERLGLSIKFIGLAAFSKDEAHDERHCVHCGKAIPIDSVYCPYCGEKQENNICSNCGAEIPDGAVFCPKCGTRR